MLLAPVMMLCLLLDAGRADATVLTDVPCPGCVLSIPPGYNPAYPAPLLVALHGDEGAPSIISSVWDPVGDQSGAIVLSPECPRALGCAGSWWGWLQSGSYDDTWLGRQVDQVASRYNVDRGREYLTGWSGGADFLGWYALEHADRFAAAAFVVGGVPYHPQCPTSRLPAYFLMGSNDFRYQSGQPSQVKAILDGCGAPTQLTVLPGQDHNGTVGALSTQQYATTIFSWLRQYTRGATTGSLPQPPSPAGTATPSPTSAAAPAAAAPKPAIPGASRRPRHKRGHAHGHKRGHAHRHRRSHRHHARPRSRRRRTASRRPRR